MKITGPDVSQANKKCSKPDNIKQGELLRALNFNNFFPKK